MNSGSIGSLADDAFRHHHGGMTRAEWAEKVRPHLTGDDYEEAHTLEMSGDPPEGICNTRNLPPQRARLTRFQAWRRQEEQKLTELQALEAKMRAIIDTPATTEVEIRREVKKTAAHLMGREPNDGADAAKRRQLDDRLTSERHAAEAAREALSELERKIKIAKLRLGRLNGRESEFMNATLVEYAEELGLGRLYLKKIAELKQVAELIFGLSQITGRPAAFECQLHGDGFFQNAEAIRFPRKVLASTAKTGLDQFTIKSQGLPEVWKQLGLATLLNPGLDASKFVALPK